MLTWSGNHTEDPSPWRSQNATTHSITRCRFCVPFHGTRIPIHAKRKGTDPSGAIMPGVKVIATKSDTNSHFETISNADGLYTIPFLPPGTYALSAEAGGFKKYVQSGIQIGSDTRISQDVTLAVGSASEAVIVTADAGQLESVSASAGQVITTHEVESLPVNGRAPMDLAVLGYGVVNTGVRDQNRPFENSGFSAFAMGGAATGANAALLDGVPNIGTLGP